MMPSGNHGPELRFGSGMQWFAGYRAFVSALTENLRIEERELETGGLN